VKITLKQVTTNNIRGREGALISEKNPRGVTFLEHCKRKTRIRVLESNLMFWRSKLENTLNYLEYSRHEKSSRCLASCTLAVIKHPV